MTVANALERSDFGLPNALSVAQAAIHLPEVQEMLRRLAKFNLGIFMPHMHDRFTGEFQLLPDEVVQVESATNVSFEPFQHITGEASQFLPVGWVSRSGVPTPVAVCEMACDESSGNKPYLVKHKMPR